MSQQEVNKQSYLNQVKADESNMNKMAKLDAGIDQFVKKQKEKMAEYGSHLNLPERIHAGDICFDIADPVTIYNPSLGTADGHFAPEST